MDIFIVFVLNPKDGTRTAYWINADDELAARRKASRLLGKSNAEIISVNLLGILATSEVTKKKSSKRKIRKFREKVGVPPPVSLLSVFREFFEQNECFEGTAFSWKHCLVSPQSGDKTDIEVCK